MLLVWSRRAQKLKPSVWDVLFGSPEAPSAFANAIAFLRNFRRAFFDVGRPLDLKAALAERAAGARRGDRPQGARRAPPAPRARVPHRGRPPAQGAVARAREGAARPRAPRDDRGGRARARAGARRGRARRPRRTCARSRAATTRASSSSSGRFLAWVFRRLYTSVEVDEEGLARVKRAAAGAPIVLCPSHKSYVDFLVLPLVLYDHGMTPPHVAAGINLAFWPFGGIARRGGAFFIRRKVKGDRVYTAVLRAYVKHLLRDRFPQEFYVEGGRSRTGKLLFPKTGLVSMEVDAWLDGAADDVVFVPDRDRLREAHRGVVVRARARRRREGEGEPARAPRRGAGPLPPLRAALRAVRGADLAAAGGGGAARRRGAGSPWTRPGAARRRAAAALEPGRARRRRRRSAGSCRRWRTGSPTGSAAP